MFSDLELYKAMSDRWSPKFLHIKLVAAASHAASFFVSLNHKNVREDTTCLPVKALSGFVAPLAKEARKEAR